MKLYIKYVTIVLCAVILLSCNEEPIGPTYQKIGTTTSTNAFITVSPVSATEPKQNNSVTITLKYVNIKSDPAKSLVLKLREGTTGDFITIQTFDESGQDTGVEFTRTVNYTITQATGTSLTFRLELATQAEFPKLVDRAAFPVRP